MHVFMALWHTAGYIHSCCNLEQSTVVTSQDCGCSFKGVNVALFSAGGSISKKFGPIASDAKCTACPVFMHAVVTELGHRVQPR